MSARPPIARRWRAAVVFALSALAAPAPAWAAPAAGVDCFVVCPTPGCKARYALEGAHRASFCQPRSGHELSVGQKPEQLVNCAGWSVEVPAGARLSGSFRSGRGVERFTAGPGPLAPQVPRMSSGLCAGPCCQQTQAVGAQAALAGKGAKAVSVHLAGQPCLLGLPCGSVLRPAPQTGFALDAGLPETARAVQWRVREAVAGGAAFAVAVAGGRIEWPAQPLKPGAGYVYELLDAQGQLLAAGGFEVLSSRMQQDIDADLAAARREAPVDAALAVVEVLLDNDLQWDAVQPPR